MLFGHNFRRLPPLLRVLSIVGPVCFLATLTLWASALGFAWVVRNLCPNPPHQSALELASGRILVIALNLAMLGLACTFVISTYSTRFRQPDSASYPFRSWQRQLRAIVLVAALPVCALALAVIIPVTASAFAIVFPISLIGAVVLGVFLAMNSGPAVG